MSKLITWSLFTRSYCPFDSVLLSNFDNSNNTNPGCFSMKGQHKNFGWGRSPHFFTTMCLQIYCPNGLLCRDLSKIYVCLSVRASAPFLISFRAAKMEPKEWFKKETKNDTKMSKVYHIDLRSDTA